MNLGERTKEILRAVIEIYVKTAEPVGSEAVTKSLGTKVSSATVRSEMAELVSLGLLEQPHTSAGRVPSVEGYRVYVDQLMGSHSISSDDARVIDSTLEERGYGQSHMLDKVSSLTSRLTTYPAYSFASATGLITIARFDFILVDSYTFIIVTLMSNDAVKNKIVHLTTPIGDQMLTKLSAVFNASFTSMTEDRITTQLIMATERAIGDSNGVVAIVAAFTIELLVEEKTAASSVSGTVNLLSHPEYHDAAKAQKLMHYLSDSQGLRSLPSPEKTGELKITVGPEDLAEELKGTSVIAVKYDAGNDMQGLIGVIGPTRMEYSKVAAHLSYIANGLSLMLGNNDLLQIGLLKSDNSARIGDDNIG